METYDNEVDKMLSMKRMQMPPVAGQLPPPPSSRPESPAPEPKMQFELLASVRRHWVVALCLVIGVLAVGGFKLRHAAHPTYSTRSEIYLSPKFPKVLATDSETELPYDSYVDNQIQTVTRRDIIAAAIESLPFSVRHRIGPALPYEIQVLQNSLKVKRVLSSYEISIGIDGPTPQGLAETVNAVANGYVETSKKEEFFGLDQRLATLQTEKEHLKQEMDSRLSEQATLMQQLGLATIASAQSAGNPYDATVGQMRQEAVTARVQREAAEAQLSAVSVPNSTSGSAIATPAIDDAIASDASLASTYTALSNRRTVLTGEISGLTPEHPVYKRDQIELGSIDASIKDIRHKAAERVEEKMKEEVNRTRMIEVQREREVAQQTNSATSAAPKFQRALEIGPEIDSLQKEYAAIDDRIRDLNLESNSPGSIHISSPALTPYEPEPSKLVPMLGGLLFVALALGFAAPIGMDMMDGRIFTANDVVRTVGFHPMATLLDEMEFAGALRNEYYFRLAAGVYHAVQQTSARTFLFTSPTHECGNTTVVQELGQLLTTLGLRTKIITAGTDGIQPPDPQAAAQERMEGPRQQFSSSGTLSSAPSSMVLHQVIDQFDVILIDANPLPLSAYTEHLARMTDVTMMVVRAGTSTRAELKRATSLLERLEVTGVAVVLNQITRERADAALRRELSNYERKAAMNRRIHPLMDGPA